MIPPYHKLLYLRQSTRWLVGDSAGNVFTMTADMCQDTPRHLWSRNTYSDFTATGIAVTNRCDGYVKVPIRQAQLSIRTTPRTPQLEDIQLSRYNLTEPPFTILCGYGPESHTWVVTRAKG
jgi:hypothetical protein